MILFLDLKSCFESLGFFVSRPYLFYGRPRRPGHAARSEKIVLRLCKQRFGPDSDPSHDGKPGLGTAGTEFRSGNARHDFEVGWFDRLNLPACGKRLP